MTNRFLLTSLLLLVMMVLAACGTQDVVVDEALPTSAPAAQIESSPTAEEAMADDEMADDEAMTDDEEMSDEMSEDEAMADDEAAMQATAEPTAEATAEATAEPTATPAGPTTLKSGAFRAADNTVSATGTAAAIQLEDGSRILRFEQFEVTPGPDLYVILVPKADVLSEADNAGYVNLGVLKGNVGDQNYTIPPDLDLSSDWTAVVWCKDFDHNFGIAPLGE